MALTTEQFHRLEKSLLRHRAQLDTLLNHPERDVRDLHLPIAGQLRVLLTDKSVPILLEYAQDKGVDLRIWGPQPAGSQGDPRAVVDFNALVASWEPVADGYEMSITEYLDTALGAVPLISRDTSKRPVGSWYTPRQLIKWVSNKEGVTHLDFDPPATLRSLKDGFQFDGTVEGFGAVDEFLIRWALVQLGKWTLRAIDYSLEYT
jgi:hypothetical protein